MKTIKVKIPMTTIVVKTISPVEILSVFVTQNPDALHSEVWFIQDTTTKINEKVIIENRVGFRKVALRIA